MERIEPLSPEDTIKILELIDLAKVEYIHLEFSKCSPEECKFSKWTAQSRGTYEMYSFDKQCTRVSCGRPCSGSACGACTHEEIATIINTTEYQLLKVFIQYTHRKHIKINLLSRSVEFNGMEPCFTGPQIKELIGYSLREITVKYA